MQNNKNQFDFIWIKNMIKNTKILSFGVYKE